MDKDVIDGINSIIQVTLASVGLWYTVETRKLRHQSEKQSKTAQSQKRLSIAPYLVVGVLPRGNALESLVKNAGDVADEEKQKFLSTLANAQKDDTFLYVARIDNPTEKVAIEIDLYIYDDHKKSYLTGDTGKQVISPKETEQVSVSKPYMTEVEVSKDIEIKYGLVEQFISAKKQIEQGWSMIFLLYRDIEGYPYLVARPFMFDEDGNSVFKSQLFFFNNE